jgi:peptidyl-dipeptidase Dcp
MMFKGGWLFKRMGDKYRKEILEVGNSRDLMESYKAFRGQEPDTSALLKRRGLKATVQ